MTFMTMEEKLHLRHGQIDHEHQEIFDIIDRLAFAIKSGNGKSAGLKGVNELINLMARHFLLEEGLMAAYHDPFAAQHKSEHEHLISELVSFRKNLVDGADLSCLKQLSLLRAGQCRHIRGADKALVAELRRQDYVDNASQAHA